MAISGLVITYNEEKNIGKCIDALFEVCDEVIIVDSLSADNTVKIAEEKGIKVKAGNILTSDEFYGDNFESYKHWAKFGVLAVEMETAGLYTVAAKHGVKALTILTISDSLVNPDNDTTAEERQTTFKDMIEIALEI